MLKGHAEAIGIVIAIGKHDIFTEGVSYVSPFQPFMSDVVEVLQRIPGATRIEVGLL